MKTRALVLAAAAALLTGPAAADTLLECASGGYKYTYCPADTRYGVQLEKQKSSSPCVLNDTWGYDGGGVWTDRGCRGVFRILSGRKKPPPPPPPPVEDDLVAAELLTDLEYQDEEDRREPGYGRADALIACAAYGEQEELARGARSVFVETLDDIVPRGRRTYDLSFTLTVTDSRRRVRDYAAECTVERGTVTSYVRY